MKRSNNGVACQSFIVGNKPQWYILRGTANHKQPIFYFLDFLAAQTSLVSCSQCVQTLLGNWASMISWVELSIWEYSIAGKGGKFRESGWWCQFFIRDSSRSYCVGRSWRVTSIKVDVMILQGKNRKSYFRARLELSSVGPKMHSSSVPKCIRMRSVPKCSKIRSVPNCN